MKHSTVIDIGSSKVSCLSAATASDGALIIRGVESRSYTGYRLGKLPASGALSEAVFSALSALQHQTQLRVKNVSIGVPAPFVKTLVTRCEVDAASRSGKITDTDLGYLFAAASEFDLPDGYELMHSTPFDYTLDGAACSGSPVGLPAEKLGASFCHAFVDMRFSSLLDGILDSIGAGVGSYISETMASSTFTIPFEDRMRGAVLIDCGGTHCDVSAIRGNAVLRTESIGIGGEHFTSDVALALRLPRSVAEELKRRYVFGLDYGSSGQLVRIPSEGVFEIEHATLQMIIEARAEELAAHISAALDSLENDLSAGVPVYMVGGGIAAMRGGSEYLSAQTGRQIRVNIPEMGRLNTVNNAPVFALAQFMLYGESAQGRGAKQGGRILDNIREFFTVGGKR